MQLLQPIPTRVSHLAFSPDGWTLCSGGYHSPTIRVWNLTDSQLLGGFRPEVERCGVVDFLFTPNGEQLVASYPNRADGLLVWDMNQNALAREFPYSGSPLCLSRDGKILGMARKRDTENNPSRFGAFEFLETHFWEPLAAPHWASVRNVPVTAIGPPESLRTTRSPEHCLAGFCEDGRVLIESRTHFLRFDLQNQQPPEWVEWNQTPSVGNSWEFRSVVYSADRSRTAKVRHVNWPGTLFLHVWDTTTGEEVARRENTESFGIGTLNALAFHPMAPQLALGGKTGVSLWNFQTDELLGPFDWGVGSVTALAFAPDGLRLAVGGGSAVVICDVE
jgi:WD40 repeat protein